MTLAIGVAAACLLTIMALMPVAQRSHRSATGQSVAARILGSVILDLRTTPSTQSQSILLGVPLKGSHTLHFDAEGVVAQSPDAYRLTVAFVNPPQQVGTRFAAFRVTWPGQSGPAEGVLETFAAFDR